MRSFRRLVLVLVAVLPVLAGSVAAELPPLIDRELFFGDPEVAGAQLSPDGRSMSFIRPYKDVRNIWVKPIDAPFEQARPVTADTRPVPGYFWSTDGKYLLYVQDKLGNENFHVYAVDPNASAETATGVPPARDLTPIDGIRAAIYSVPEKTPDVILVGLNDRDATWHDLYKITISTGAREMLRQNTQKVGAWVFDLDGSLRLAYRQKDDGGNEILRVEGEDLKPIYDVSYLEEMSPIRFHKDGKRVYLETNKGNVDLLQLELLDVATGKTQIVESDPESEVDLSEAVFDKQNDELMVTAYSGDRLRTYPQSPRAKQDLERARKQFPDSDVRWGSATEDMRLQLVGVTSDVEPGASYLYDRRKGTFTLQYRVRPKLKPEELARMKPIRYKARDGMVIPAFLTLPRGVPAKNLPTIIHPHGGPWSRDDWGYDSYAQFLANRGYAVLQPNFRASSGYGKKHLNAGNHEWGTGAMQHDLTDGVQYLVQEGIADPKRVGIFGGSYGGYATLAGVAYTPELYACGVPYVAPSSLVSLIESFPAYWRPFLKGSWYLRVGDPSVAEQRADLEKRSPLFAVDKIRVPLLVVHGANDPRVKQSESDRIVAALRDKGAAVEYIVAPDEGHGFRAPENNLALAASMEKFLAKHLGGRYQESMNDVTSKRLAAITVDPKSVQVADASASAAALEQAMKAPLPAADGNRLTATSMQYSAAFEVGGRKIPMDFTRNISESTANGRTVWRVNDEATTPMGKMSDTVDLDRQSLAPVARKASGLGNIELTYSSDQVTGSMGAAGQSMPITAKLEAPVLSDGAGLDVTIAALPLAAGYKTMLRTFEPTSQKVRPIALEVKGEETVSVGAGTVPVFVVALTPLDDEPGGTSTLHVMKESPHHVVKANVRMPAAAGGGTMTCELKSAGAGIATRDSK